MPLLNPERMRNKPERIRVELEDGSLLVPAEYVAALGEEYDEMGPIGVAQAQVLVERWQREARA